MSFLDKICCVCLSNCEFVSDLKHMFDVDDDGVSHYNKLTSSIAEMDFEEMNDQRLCICEGCCTILNTVYNFRQTCLNNKTNLMKYIARLQESKNGSDNSREDIQTRNNRKRTKEIKVECEYEDNSYKGNSDSPNLSKNSQDNISPVLIKKEYDSEEEYHFPRKIEAEDHVNRSEDMEDDHETNVKFSTVYIQNPMENSSEGENDAESELSTFSSIPEKSRGRYLITYGRFNAWCKDKNVKRITEKELLGYFMEKSDIIKSSTIRSEYSMLKATLVAKNGIDISKMNKLVAFLKRKVVGYKSKNAGVFYIGEIVRFLEEAPDDTYLMMKVVLILGVAGGCRREELKNMMLDDVEDIGSMIIVTIPDLKNKTHRKFTVTTGDGGPNLLEIVRRYASLRPADATHRRFFLSFRYGRCFPQSLGLNIIGKIPQKIATYLGLQNAHLYSGHSFRRSTTFLVDSRVDITTFSSHNTSKTNDENHVNQSEPQCSTASNK